MRKILLSSMIIALMAAAVLLAGCSNGVYTGTPDENKEPEIWLSSGPVEGDTTGYQVHFYWSGWDPDGEIEHFEFVVAEGDPIGFNPADTTGLDKWISTSVHDSTFRVPADDNPRPWQVNPLYTKYDKTHTFFIRAVDMEGKRSEPAYRSFTAWTLAPTILIERPIGTTRTYSTVITFGWTGSDPIDSPQNSQDPDSIRYLWSQIINRDGIYDPTFNIIADLNQDTEYYEHLWSPWIWYRADGDSGRETILGDDEILELNKSHIFALQAKDDAGAVTAVFQKERNVRQFLVSFKSGPLLTVTETFLGSNRFLGTDMNYVQSDLPPGVPLNFSWKATAEDYGGEIQSFRYGWDIQQIDDPSQWAVSASPFIKNAESKTFYSGVHRFLVEVVDNGQKITYGKIEVTIVPFSMERTLLWVDDYPLGGVIPSMTDPSEAVHDTFWVNICKKAYDFRPDRDVYDVSSQNSKPPEMRQIGLYANIIWTYSSSINTAWKKVIPFVAESRIGTGTQLTVNYLALFMAKGGHLLSEGRADRSGGGLVDAFTLSPLLPASFKFDMGTTSEDTSGVNSMPYKDYCVSVVDKVSGIFHSGEEMAPNVNRSLDRDALRLALKINDPTGDGGIVDYPEFPDSLTLDPSVTCSSCFFNPQVRGFTYVEVYDPRYWLDFKLIPSSLGCFRPMYKMRARSTISPLDNQAVAVIITKYRKSYEDDIANGVPVTILPADSFHFGFPLWFFKHSQVNKIMDEIFAEWQILND
jgi:hypothetical protein